MGKKSKNSPRSQVPRLVNDFFDEICRYSDHVASMKWDENMSYQLISKQPCVIMQTIHERQVPVSKLYSGFYIYASISFMSEDNKRKQEFSSLSMHFFDDKDLLFRAELANPKYHKEETGHPQPHWHLVGNRRKVPNSQHESFSEFVDSQQSFSDFVGDISEKPRYDYGRIHFTMDYINLEMTSFDDNSIREWIKQSLKTINEELVFISTKK